MYDTIIIGAGPAGMTAGLYLARKKYKSLILSKTLGGQLVWSGDVENYLGIESITGADLTLKFEKHLEKYKDDLQLKVGLEVIEISRNFTSFVVETKKGEQFFSKSLIIAVGKNPKKLGIPGEDNFLGKGVCVCATCDAPLYKNKTVAVIGGGNSALDALLTLSKVANRIYSINIGKELAGDEILKQKVEISPNITYFNHSKVVAINGVSRVESMDVQDSKGKLVNLPLEGVFIEIGYEAHVEFDMLTAKNERGEIKVDRNLQTSIPGIFAAGDCNDAWGDQIIIAAGEGAKAAIACSDYLNRLKIK